LLSMDSEEVEWKHFGKMKERSLNQNI